MGPTARCGKLRVPFVYFKLAGFELLHTDLSCSYLCALELFHSLHPEFHTRHGKCVEVGTTGCGSIHWRYGCSSATF